MRCYTVDELEPKKTPTMMYGLELGHGRRGRCRGGESGASCRCPYIRDHT
jgi:hypothetical protein